VRQKSFGLPPVLAEPPRQSRRRHIIVAIAVAHLAVLLGTAGIIVLVQRSEGGQPSVRPAATLTSPGNRDGAAAAFSPDGRTLAIDDGTSLYLWDVAARHQIGTTTHQLSPGSYSFAFRPDGRMVATTQDGFGGSTYLLQVPTGHLIATLNDPDSDALSSATSAAFSPDGKTLATGDEDDSAYLWNVATGHLIATLTDPEGAEGPGGVAVESVAFSPDGTTLATGDGNGSVYLWNVATGHLVATLPSPARVSDHIELGVNSVAFSPDGKTLATGNYDGDIFLWDVGGS